MNLVSKFAGAEVGIGEDGLVQGDRSVNSLHHELAQSARSMRAMASSRSTAVDDELGNERVVVGRDDAFRVLRRVHAHAVAAGHVE